MIKRILFIVSLSVLIGCVNAQQVEYNEYFHNGNVFHNVKIVKTSPAWVSIHHSSGIKSCVPINTLSDELRQFFQYKHKVAVAWHGAYLKSTHNEMVAAQERAQERERLNRLKNAQDLVHIRKLELIRAKQNTNWKTDMRNSRPICKNPSSRRRVVNNHHHYHYNR